MKEEGIWDMRQSRIDELMSRHSEAQTGSPVTYTYTEATAKELLAEFTIAELRKRTRGMSTRMRR